MPSIPQKVQWQTVDSDQMPQNVAYDQGLNCLHLNGNTKQTTYPLHWKSHFCKQCGPRSGAV